jgi:alpha-glucuronidase
MMLWMARALCAWAVAGLALAAPAKAEDGYDLWLRYHPVETENADAYRAAVASLVSDEHGAVIDNALAELERGLTGLLGAAPQRSGRASSDGALIVGTAASPLIGALGLDLSDLGEDGYVIRSVDADGRRATVIAGGGGTGALYGAFHYLRLIQTRQDVADLDITERPAFGVRMLNHWDNLDGTVERGYAGFSLWDWHKLPHYLDPRYTDYARANASLGINGTAVNNVNTDALSLTPQYLEKAAALADVFRPWGIRLYLSARFSAPVEIGGLDTADPLDPAVTAWWADKAAEVYEHIPDFGGFLVKANSEGQPGPQDYGRTHADGANMLAAALEPHGGVVMWRAFVYDDGMPADRVAQSYDEFTPLDGRFADNVIIQSKNGPLDFQPREPFHPLFGAMEQTPLMIELQITKEYLGHATHLAYLGELWEETLQWDTMRPEPGTTVARTIDGSAFGHELTAIAGVANTGTDRNWSGSQFNQANWHAFGRLAWNPGLSARELAEEWARMTFTNDAAFLGPVVDMMMSSRETVAEYMTPLGLHHLMGESHHYGPAPWVTGRAREDWNNTYFHLADETGIGFDRTMSGSDQVSQYAPELAQVFSDTSRMDERLLLWFHRLEWDFQVQSGRTLWEEMAHKYTDGARGATAMRETWEGLEGFIDQRRHDEIAAFLAIQEREAWWWRDACLAYFSDVSGRPVPQGLPEPEHDLEHYMSLSFPHAPGI